MHDSSDKLVQKIQRITLQHDMIGYPNHTCLFKLFSFDADIEKSFI